MATWTRGPKKTSSPIVTAQQSKMQQSKLA
jgi:hypothetical protein